MAHQKLALAHRGAGRHHDAAVAITTATDHDHSTAPLRTVQLMAARGHILASDRANRACGLGLLTAAAQTAQRHDLGHQLSSITKIRRSIEGGPPAW